MNVIPLSIESVEASAASGDNGGGRKRALVFAGNYLPGYKSGGPIRSIANMIAFLGQHYDFYVVTRDKDPGDLGSYPGVTPNRWYRVGNARVLYCSSIRPAVLRRAFLEVRPDFICLNSFQDALTRTTVLLHRVGVFGDTPIILAPRGEFSPGAMGIKQVKKVLYRHLAKLLGLYDNLMWQVTNPREKLDLLRAAPAQRLKSNAVHIVPNICDALASTAPHAMKESGSVKLAFISRISEMKNLHFLIEILQQIRGEVQLDLFGPVAENDVAYWEKCRKLITRAPDNIQVVYKGSLDHSAVPAVLHDHHFFILPTRGENFCHSAVESIINGTPVILSDETPWNSLSEKRAGFDIPLQDRKGWVVALQKCVDMDQKTYEVYLHGTREYSRQFSVEAVVQQHLVMFEAVLRKRQKFCK
jgi:glycosyltransferase involved in cell wall biosynthesis